MAYHAHHSQTSKKGPQLILQHSFSRNSTCKQVKGASQPQSLSGYLGRWAAWDNCINSSWCLSKCTIHTQSGAAPVCSRLFKYLQVVWNFWIRSIQRVCMVSHSRWASLWPKNLAVLFLQVMYTDNRHTTYTLHIIRTFNRGVNSANLEAEPSCARILGHHIYKWTWTPSGGEEFLCKWESGNNQDAYAFTTPSNINRTLTLASRLHPPNEIWINLSGI